MRVFYGLLSQKLYWWADIVLEIITAVFWLWLDTLCRSIEHTAGIMGIFQPKGNNNMKKNSYFHSCSEKLLLSSTFSKDLIYRFGGNFRILYPLRNDQRVNANQSFIGIMRHFEYFCALFVVVFLTYGGIPFVCKDGKKHQIQPRSV